MARLLTPDVDARLKPSSSLHLHSGSFRTPWHKHPARHQLLFVSGGVMHVDTEQGTTLLPACHAAWVPAGHHHRLRAELEEVTLRTIYFHAEAQDPPLFAELHVFAVDQLGKEMIAYCERWAEDGTTVQLETTLLQTIREFVPLWCAAPLSLSLPAVDHPRLNPVITHIHNNLADTLAVEEVAATHGMSGRTMIRLFSDALGMKFSMYKKLARVIRATELLSEGNRSVVEVMFEVGYSSQGSFTRIFQQLVGSTPGQYRSLSARSASLPLAQIRLD